MSKSIQQSGLVKFQPANEKNTMGLFDKFAGSDVTKNWAAQPGHDLVLDLDRAAFCGASFERHIDDLSWLGSAEDRAEAKRGKLCYYSLGLCVHVKEDLFVGVHVYFRKPNYQSFTGKIISLGNTLPTCPSTTEEAIECFGQPLDTEDDGDAGFLHEYNYKDNWFELQFNRDELLESISVI